MTARQFEIELRDLKPNTKLLAAIPDGEGNYKYYPLVTVADYEDGTAGIVCRLEEK